MSLRSSQSKRKWYHEADMSFGCYCCNPAKAWFAQCSLRCTFCQRTSTLDTCMPSLAVTAMAWFARCKYSTNCAKECQKCSVTETLISHTQQKGSKLLEQSTMWQTLTEPDCADTAPVAWKCLQSGGWWSFFNPPPASNFWYCMCIKFMILKLVLLLVKETAWKW